MEAYALVGLLAVAAFGAGMAGRFGLSAPLVLTALGLILSPIPGVPDYPLDPEVVLVGILPPLIYATAIRTPWVDMRRNRRPIALLSVGLVVFTTVVVAGVVKLVLPDVPTPVAVALGAVVSPPDAVAATAVARRIGMPRRVVAVLEGESLLNDGTALALLRTAVAAIGGSWSLLGVTGNFLLAVGAGLVVGWVVALGVSLVRRRVNDPVVDTSISLLAPYLTYLPAEAVHGSGVIAVVVAGLMLGHRSPEIQSAASRVTERTIWRTVQFLLESSVFLLIGLQLWSLLRDAAASRVSEPRIVLLCLAVLAVVLVTRIVWVFPATYLPRLIPAVARNDPAPPIAAPALIAWSGMRGVVTLAAALTIPEDVADRDVLVVAAFSVVAGTLLIQGPTLPWVMRVLRARGPDPVHDALQRALVQQRSALAGLRRLDDAATRDDPPEVVDGLRNWGERVANAAWERLGANGNERADGRRETPAAAFYRLRVAMLEAERGVAVDVRRNGSVPPDVVEQVLERVDQEEAMLTGFAEGTVAGPEDAPTPDDADAGCEHLRATACSAVSPTSSPDACPDCLAEGVHSWVHLRMCLQCGHVGCCDSSPRRHADAHYAATGHPVMRSLELGESWRWCYVDAELG